MRRLGVALLLALLVLPGSVGLAVSDAAVSTYTGFVVSDERGQTTKTTDLDPAALTGWFNGQEVAAGTPGWAFFFYSGDDPFHLGSYVDLEGTLGGQAPALSVTHLSGCSFGQRAEMTILELPEADLDGNLVRFAVDFRWRCAKPVGDTSSYDWMYVSLRFGALTPPTLGMAPGDLTFPDTFVGQSSDLPVTVTGIGSGTTTIADIAVTGGADPSMFSVVDDLCTDAALDEGTTCTFSIRFTPTATTPRSAVVSVTPAGTSYPHPLGVSGIGRSATLAIPSVLRLNSDPGMWIGEGAVVDDHAAVMTNEDSADPSGVYLAIPHGWLIFYPDAGESLAVGHYEVPAYPPMTGPSMAVSAFGHGCQPTGSFDVLDAPVRDVDGSLLSVAIDFTQFCDGGSDRLRGSIRFHSTKPPWDIVGPVGSVELISAADAVSDPNVALDVTATDDTGVASVLLSNDGTSWMTRSYDASVEWSLVDPAYGGTPGEGTKVVSIRWTDVLGNVSAPMTRSIVLDQKSPTGTTSIAAGAPYTSSEIVVVNVPAADDGSGVDRVALSNDGVTWTTRPYAPTQSWALPTGNGSRTVFVKWGDAAGNWSAVTTDTIVLDTVAPTAAIPTRSLLSGTAISAGRIMARLAWSGSDATSGIARYELQQSTDAGAWSTVSTSLTSPTVDRLLAPSHRYTFRVRAIDKAGNAGTWMAGPTASLSQLSEKSSSIKFSSSWHQTYSSVFWGGGAKKSTTAGAKATVTFTGRTIAFVSRLGPTKGRARIYVDGALVKTVDLYASTYKSERVVWARTFASTGKHTVSVVVYRIATRPRVDIDAFVIGG
jgi:hypothetical protein